ncbi:MAG: chorismate-binding protein [Myxococcales bacterium]|nr:chorismate-binding protein [Myxococcales bacterium]
MRILLVDNHDSFTHNLAHGLRVAGARVRVVPHETPFEALGLADADGVVISPGPGRPEVAGDFGVCGRVIAEARVPLLGVCLGHQGIGAAFGARVGAAPRVMHGRLSAIRHSGDALFEGVPQGARVVRYHSLAVDELPDALVPLAWADDGVLMALRHRARPLWGVQFHPESVCTEGGGRLLANFVRICGGSGRGVAAVDRAPRAVGAASHGLRVEAAPGVDAEAVYLALFAGRAGAVWLDGARFGVLGVGEAAVRYRVGEGEGVWGRIAGALAARRVAAEARPFPFAGGLVGYLGYELKAECGGAAAHVSPFPDAVLLRLDRFVVVDRVEGRAWLAAVEAVGAGGDDGWFAETRARLAEAPAPGPPGPAITGGEAVVRMARSAARYRADIGACFAALAAGESYELCLTTQLVTGARVDAVALHRRLRRANPAPYAALLELEELSVVSASPERFLRVTAGGAVEAKPIKGTRARGADAVSDAAARDDLASAEKDRAENLMICDLLRNDLGRVCVAGSVHVPRLMAVESHPTVHQLVSTVRGRLRPGVSAVECVRAAFPPGSMTGAPKERTMAILDALEGEARGVYSGAMGWFGYDGAADLAVVIRTAVVDASGCRIGVGGAVVALSDPDAEVAEALLKGQALLAALGARLVEGEAE